MLRRADWITIGAVQRMREPAWLTGLTLLPTTMPSSGAAPMRRRRMRMIVSPLFFASPFASPFGSTGGRAPASRHRPWPSRRTRAGRGRETTGSSRSRRGERRPRGPDPDRARAARSEGRSSGRFVPAQVPRRTFGSERCSPGSSSVGLPSSPSSAGSPKNSRSCSRRACASARPISMSCRQNCPSKRR